MKVCLDPGHGASDSGAVANGITEKTVNLKVALAVSTELKRRGHTVVMTRTSDTDFAAGVKPGAAPITTRGCYSVVQKADIFVSIHHDASGSASARGCSGFYHEGAPNGKDLAAQCTTRLHEKFAMPYAYGPPARVHWVNLGVLRGCDNWRHVTCCLVECAMLTNATDAANIKEPGYAAKAAKCIADGIEAHAAKEGLIAEEPLADTGVVVVELPGDKVLTRRGREVEPGELWVPLREVAEAQGYTVIPHIEDQGKVYLTKDVTP